MFRQKFPTARPMAGTKWYQVYSSRILFRGSARSSQETDGDNSREEALNNLRVGKAHEWQSMR